MEFDKSKVYTALNADENLIGAKGYFADKIDTLKEDVESKSIEINELTGNDGCQLSNASLLYFNFFYLVEPAEKWYVFKNNVFEYETVKNPQGRNRNLLFFEGSEKECEQWILEHSKKYRPFKDCDELIETYKANWCSDLGEYDMPAIWVKSKSGNVTSMITYFNRGTKFIKDSVDFSYGSTDMDYLFGNYTFLDGSVCGVEK